MLLAAVGDPFSSPRVPAAGSGSEPAATRTPGSRTAGALRPEGRDPVAVLEGQPDPEVVLECATDRIAGHGAQELPAGQLVGRGRLVVDEVRGCALQTAGQTGDQTVGVRQGGADAVRQ